MFQITFLLASLAALTGADTPDKTPSLEERVSALEAGAAAAPSPQAGGESFKVTWKDGLRFEAQDGSVKIRFGGRILNDWGWFSGDETFDLEDGTEFRAARLYVSGTFHERYEFKAQYDVEDGEADFKDVYMGVLDTGAGNIRVGQFKEPFSLEELTSSNDTTFMERATLFAFVPDRNTGLMFHDHSGDRFTWAAGVFRDTDAFGDDSSKTGGDGEYSYTARVTGLPLYEEEGESLVHLGLSYSVRTDEEGTVSFSARPEQNQVNTIASSGAIASDGYNVGVLETAWVNGPLSLQGEYAMADVDNEAGSDPSYSAYYAYLSWVLTGEHRPYKTSEGAFGRVKPERPWGKDGGCGAWELGLRYSMIDFDDGPSMDTLEDITLGLNWYLIENARVMLNYVHSEYDDGVTEEDDANLLGLRFQLTF